MVGAIATNGQVEAKAEHHVVIKPLNLQTIEFTIEGSAPLAISRFPEKSKQQIKEKQEKGTQARSKRERTPREFEADCEAAKHVSMEGWLGIHAASFRNALISACGAAGFVMTKAKMGVFIEPDGFDRADGAPLVRITSGEPELWIAPVRNDGGGADLRARPMWRNWSATVRVRFDGDMFSADDIVNLMNRAGQQVGVGEGRPYSKKSNGIGFGTFTLV